MRLVKEIEIAYFRSIYKQRLDKLTPLTILFGRNDSGKSNVLRALNLFFNNQTNPNQPFSFQRDICHARIAEAATKQDARKFVAVKLTFETPENWRKSLGNEFWVKKSWSVTKEADPNYESSVRSRAKQQYLTRFLNKVQFHYIPAIKDRAIFEHLLGEIYKVVAVQKEFLTSLSAFSSELRARTLELSNGLSQRLGLDSVIAPPTDLIGLFRSLDFETKTTLGDACSLTLQRGDGVQMQHIPEILAFISDRSAMDYHLWGFEEPENSLELASAIQEAQSFCEYARNHNKQIFLTSHSPAFFALETDIVRRYFVATSARVLERPTSDLILVQPGAALPGDLMGETPHLAVISSYLKEADAEIRALQDEGQKLTAELKTRDVSLLFVEGESDEIILRAAWKHYYGGTMPFEVVQAAGTSKMKSLAADGAVLNRLAPNRQLLVLVDNDKEGRELYRQGKLDPGGVWVNHNSNGTWWCRLPWIREFQAEMANLSVPKSNWPGCLENLFPRAVRQDAIAAGTYLPATEPHDELLESNVYKKISKVLLKGDDIERIYLVPPEHELKIPFAEWVVEQSGADPSLLEPLQPIVRWLAEKFEVTKKRTSLPAG